MLRVLPGNHDAPKTGQEQTVIQRGLVTSRSAMFAAPASTTLQKPQTPAPSATSASTTQPKRALPTPPKSKEIDLDKALGWITIYEKDIEPKDYQMVIDDIKTGVLNLLEKDEKGLNWLHSAAKNGSAEFFKLIQSMPDVWKQVKDHINDFSDEHCTVLGYAIKAHRYDFALELTQKCSANYNMLVHDPICGQPDHSASMLRLAVSGVFLLGFQKNANEQREYFSSFVDKLLSQEFKFFYTPGSSLPPASELLVDRFGTEEIEKKDADGQLIKVRQRKKYFYDLMAQYHWDEKKDEDVKKAIIIQNLRILCAHSREIFRKIRSEARSLQFTENNDAKLVLHLCDLEEFTFAKEDLKNPEKNSFKSF